MKQKKLKQAKQSNTAVNNLCSLIVGLCGKDREKADELIITILAGGVMEILAEYDDAGHKEISENGTKRLQEILDASGTGLTLEDTGNENIITIDNFLEK